MRVKIEYEIQVSDEDSKSEKSGRARQDQIANTLGLFGLEEDNELRVLISALVKTSTVDIGKEREQ
jgi:hypothetical protein